MLIDQRRFRFHEYRTTVWILHILGLYRPWLVPGFGIDTGGKPKLTCPGRYGVRKMLSYRKTNLLRKI